MWCATPSTTTEATIFIGYLKSKKQQLLAIIFCRREGTLLFFSQVLDTGELIFPATKLLLLRSKHSDPDKLKEFLKLHQFEVQNWSWNLCEWQWHTTKTGRTDWQNQGQPTETITDKEEGESKTRAEARAEEESALQNRGEASVH